jgi:hypothetical protein
LNANKMNDVSCFIIIIIITVGTLDHCKKSMHRKHTTLKTVSAARTPTCRSVSKSIADDSAWAPDTSRESRAKRRQSGQKSSTAHLHYSESAQQEWRGEMRVKGLS